MPLVKRLGIRAVTDEHLFPCQLHVRTLGASLDESSIALTVYLVTCVRYVICYMH